jgi:hypothetical protein
LAGIRIAVLCYINADIGKPKSCQFIVLCDLESTGTADKRQSRDIKYAHLREKSGVDGAPVLL